MLTEYIDKLDREMCFNTLASTQSASSEELSAQSTTSSSKNNFYTAHSEEASSFDEENWTLPVLTPCSKVEEINSYGVYKKKLD
jgi:hypothetical protein